jgi:heavy metal sensor kinase
VIRSLRRTLAVRFAATMALGLAVASAGVLWGASRILAGNMHANLPEVVFALGMIVAVGTAATLVGAWRLAGSAVGPVAEITEQAQHIATGTLDQRIAAHADTEEYEGLVTVLNRMLERIEQGFRAQQRLTADVSHELRTPLTALRGEMEVALRAPRSTDEYRRVLKSGLEEIERLSDLTEDALFITRADGHLIKARRESVDLNSLVRELAARWRDRADANGVRLTLALDEALPVVSLDPALVCRMAEHLVENAVQHSPQGGVVELATVRAPSGAVRLAVADAGPGIPETIAGHVFEPFYRADPARPRSPGDGPGLGLAVVASVARLHGGGARVVNVMPRGSRFEVDFPVFQAA